MGFLAEAPQRHSPNLGGVAMSVPSAALRRGAFSTISGPFSAGVILGRSVMDVPFRLGLDYPGIAADLSRLDSHTQKLRIMALAETSVITAPGTKLTKPPRSMNRKYPTSANPPTMAVTQIAVMFPRQMKTAPMVVARPIQSRLNPC